MTDFRICNNIFINFNSHKENWENQIFKLFYSQILSNFNLVRISDIYSEIEDGKTKAENLVFLDEQERGIKIKRITKENYNGRIYDLTVPNHIILVKRGNLIVWSGNSYNNFTGLAEGTHNFKAYAQDYGGNVNSTEQRTVTIGGDTIYPQFSNYSDNNGSLINTGIGLFNVTVTSTNGTVLLEINNTNITATNLTSNIYNVSYSFTSNGTYTYRWHSWGNGTLQNYNKSDDRSYTVNNGVTGCGTLNSANSTYILLNNVTSTDTCFTIGANNITLDCQGYEINYSSNGGDSEYGFYSNKNFTTIKNCVIKEGAVAGANKYAIYFSTVDNGTIYNNTIKTTNSVAIWADGVLKYNNFSNNIINTTGSDSIYLNNPT
jgi:hypothetical protein